MARECIVLLTAAGSGSRFGGDHPKQYNVINGKTILEHTVNVFLSLSIVKQVILIVSPSDKHINEIIKKHYLNAHKLTILPVGGMMRANGIYNSLCQLKCNADEWILVHDIARCCISSHDVLRLFDELYSDPVGGILAVPVTDTIKYSEDGAVITKTLARQNIYMAQTPQMFRYKILIEAMNSADLNLITDDASAVEALGFPVRLVMGSYNNLKITYPHDIELAQIILSRV